MKRSCLDLSSYRELMGTLVYWLARPTRNPGVLGSIPATLYPLGAHQAFHPSKIGKLVPALAEVKSPLFGHGVGW